MIPEEWILCPVCGGKTRDKIRADTVLINYPLYCPKCKRNTLITAKNMKITVIKEPDAQAQGRWFTGKPVNHRPFIFHKVRQARRIKKTEFWRAVSSRPKTHPLNSVLSLEGFFCVGLILPRRYWLEAAVIYIPPYRSKDNLLKKSSFPYGPILPLM